MRHSVLGRDGVVYDASGFPGPHSFVNHSCQPNTRLTDSPCGETGEFMLVAIDNICVGESITFDYRWVLGALARATECLCGSEFCKGIIEHFDEVQGESDRREVHRARQHSFKVMGRDYRPEHTSNRLPGCVCEYGSDVEANCECGVADGMVEGDGDGVWERKGDGSGRDAGRRLSGAWALAIAGRRRRRRGRRRLAVSGTAATVPREETRRR